ncbi:MAG TPA: hypothetical protein VH206_13675 [Xanthobacteraceae bacterium]|jgi:hypothetical protein|nr:hypothetical protein [Xanthobacteraceae bacterium]
MTDIVNGERQESNFETRIQQFKAVLDETKEFAKQPASNILFGCGVSLLVFTYAAKFLRFPLFSDMTSVEFIFSAALGFMFLASGSLMRLYIFQTGLKSAIEAEEALQTAEDKVLDRRVAQKTLPSPGTGGV